MVLLSAVGAPLGAQNANRPVIDVHLHAAPAPPPRGPAQPKLDSLVPAETTDRAVEDSTIAIMRRLGVVRGVLSGAPNRVSQWMDAAPDRFIGGIVLGTNFVSVDSLRAMHARGRLGLIGEIQPIYVGRPPSDSSLEPYYALAEELDIPAGIHVQGGGIAVPGLRVAMGNPLLVEEVLVRHPRLRLYMMHAGYPFLGETIAILRSYPRVYVDVALIDWAIPTEEFYQYLQALLRAGFGDRIMFGSDAGARPRAIERAIQTIDQAPFLTAEQRRDILYNNAVRFFRLK
jgi:predicted TIM-barrel fold metal-dependent hydrolase